MVGQVLEYEAKTILNRGKKEEALYNARNLFLDGMKVEVVRKYIRSLTDEELIEVYEEVQKELSEFSEVQEETVE